VAGWVVWFLCGFVLNDCQGDQIGQNFAIWAIFLALGEFFPEKIAQ
jgi:hypothetical protein